METRILTDPPEVVEFKRRYRELDEETERLKDQIRLSPADSALRARLSDVRAEKELIARDVFDCQFKQRIRAVTHRL